MVALIRPLYPPDNIIELDNWRIEVSTKRNARRPADGRRIDTYREFSHLARVSGDDVTFSTYWHDDIEFVDVKRLSTSHNFQCAVRHFQQQVKPCTALALYTPPCTAIVLQSQWSV